MQSTDLTGLPKAVLHDHLDGGLRVGSVIELADDVGLQLPADDLESLAAWFHQGTSGSLERYLEAFEYTVGVMQTPEALSRVAFEAASDLAAEGVVYAEVRFDPGLCTRRGLSRFDVVEAVLDGLARAERDVGLRCQLIVCALRNLSDSDLAAEAAVRFQADGVVGFDLAGPEAGHPPDTHLPAINRARRAGLGITLHAGEGDGPHSIWRALALCGAQRIGHGVRIVDDSDFDGATLGTLGALARRLRDHRVPLEVAITSNLHTSTFDDARVHPFGALFRAGFNVSLNTDNRLMSGVTVTHEYAVAAEAYGLGIQDLGRITISAIEAGFGDWHERSALIEQTVKPAYGLV